ncbi:MAG: flagellar hook-length control protein FliK [Clostridia bacterium]|nr:flagellar hook-length control protein FliK [Clostridia bacterium]
MLKQNYTVDFMSKVSNAQQTIIDFKKPESTGKTGFPQFKDILEGTLNRPYSKVTGTDSNINKPETKRKDSNDTDKGTYMDQKPQFRSFREVNSAVNHEAKMQKVESKAASGTSKTEEVEHNDKAGEPKEITKSDAVLESLAQILGVTTIELTKILESVNVKPEELTNVKDIEAAVNKLAELANFTDMQKRVLSEITGSLGTILEQYSAKETSTVLKDTGSEKIHEAENIVSAKELEEKENWIEVKNVDLTVVDNNKPLQEFQAIMARLKTKLEELATKLQNNPIEFKQEINEEIKASFIKNLGSESLPETSDSSAKQDESEETQLPVNLSEKPGKSDKAAEKETKNESGNAKGDDNQAFSMTRNPEAKSSIIESSKADNLNSVQLNNHPEIQNQKSNVHEAAKVIKDSSIPKSEIIEQVVHKAKVVLTGDKSEMVMDLNPESLGKLSLKVVTERGMVVAKFVAESQQVKEALEANMQLLKDSLEKQGLAVQGFSVSVRQDSHKGFGGERQYETGRKDDGSRNGITGGINVNNEINLEKVQKTNPYAWTDSQINLTA